MRARKRLRKLLPRKIPNVSGIETLDDGSLLLSGIVLMVLVLAITLLETRP